MKLSVRNDARAMGRPRSVDGASSLSRAAAWGRFRDRWDLYESMLTLAGLFLVAEFVSLLRLPVLLEYFFAAVLIGGTVGKFAVGWHERGGDELPTVRVRHIERLWIVVGIAVMALAVAVQVALALL